MQVLGIVLSWIQVLAALVLVGLLMSQATKSEGLTGTIGGKADAVFRGKPGTEEKLAELTKWSAIVFIVISAFSGYLH
jgi:protein translocase SecG subunit